MSAPKPVRGEAIYIGIADGAASNWQFLKKHTSQQILDFYHASGYLGAVATALYPDDVNQQKQYLSQSCHQLKHEAGAATRLYKQMLKLSQDGPHTKVIQEKLNAAVTYFHNHLHQMNYSDYRDQAYPIDLSID